MNLTWPTKHPQSVLDFSWPVPVDDGDAVASILEATVVAGTVTIGSSSKTGNLITGIISGGEYGENAVIRLGALTNGGDRFFEDFLLRIQAAPAVPAAPTGVEKAADIKSDLAELRAARSKLGRGEMITEVWRNGRRLIYGKVSVESLTTLIKAREADLEAIEPGSTGKQRRRAIPLGWPN